MYLSRLALNPRSPTARRDLGDPYQLHQTLTANAGDDDRLLFRAESDAPDGPAVLVQTISVPDWHHLPEGYGRVDGPKSFEPDLREGQRLRFRLVANPTVKRKVVGRKNGTRVPLVHARAPEGGEATTGYLDWLERKAEAAGVTVDLGQTVDAPFEVRARKGGQRITLFGVRFDGELTVDDPGALMYAVRSGVGPAKGLGFGLLSLARP